MIDMDILLTLLDSNTSVEEVAPGQFKWISRTIHGVVCNRGSQTFPARWQAANDWLHLNKPHLAV